jgi:hypothetical protein
VLAGPGDLRPPVLDDHELVRELGLMQELCALADIDLVRRSSDLAELEVAERHRANILLKLGLRDRVALTRYAIRHGLIEA